MFIEKKYRGFIRKYQSRASDYTRSGGEITVTLACLPEIRNMKRIFFFFERMDSTDNPVSRKRYYHLQE